MTRKHEQIKISINLLQDFCFICVLHFEYLGQVYYNVLMEREIKYWIVKQDLYG